MATSRFRDLGGVLPGFVGSPPLDTRAVYAAHRAIATLHRAYAFWHWHQRLPRQPFPVAAADRQTWIRWVIAENS